VRIEPTLSGCNFFPRQFEATLVESTFVYMVMNNPPRELEGLKLKFYEKVQLKNAFEGDYVRGAAPAAHSLRRGGGKGTPPPPHLHPS